MLAGVALAVKEGLARQALFPVRRAEAATQNIIRAADSRLGLNHWSIPFAQPSIAAMDIDR